MIGIPWMLAFALRADGWYLRSDIIWSKPNAMPESVTDRPTKAHEYIFLFSKSERYYYDAEAIAEDSVTDDMRKPYAPGQVDARGNGHDRGGGSLRKPGGKWAATEPQDSGRRMAEATARARAEGMPHDNPFGLKRNKRTVWEIPTNPFPEAHFATFPEALIKPCILAGCARDGIVLDPFAGSGTTVLVARELQCKGIGIELNPGYIQIAKRRLAQQVIEFPLT